MQLFGLGYPLAIDHNRSAFPWDDCHSAVGGILKRTVIMQDSGPVELDVRLMICVRIDIPHRRRTGFQVVNQTLSE
jgi:hypothetical protein